MKLMKCNVFQSHRISRSHKLPRMTRACRKNNRCCSQTKKFNKPSKAEIVSLFSQSLPQFQANPRMVGRTAAQEGETPTQKIWTIDGKRVRHTCIVDKALVSPPVLAPSRKNGNNTLDTNAYDREIGSMLLQDLEDKSIQPVRQRSGTLTNQERYLATTQRETLAISCALKFFRFCAEATCVAVRIHHEKLCRNLARKEATGKCDTGASGSLNLNSTYCTEQD